MKSEFNVDLINKIRNNKPGAYAFSPLYFFVYLTFVLIRKSVKKDLENCQNMQMRIYSFLLLCFVDACFSSVYFEFIF